MDNCGVAAQILTNDNVGPTWIYPEYEGQQLFEFAENNWRYTIVDMAELWVEPASVRAGLE